MSIVQDHPKNGQPTELLNARSVSFSIYCIFNQPSCLPSGSPLGCVTAGVIAAWQAVCYPRNLSLRFPPLHWSAAICPFTDEETEPRRSDVTWTQSGSHFCLIFKPGITATAVGCSQLSRASTRPCLLSACWGLWNKAFLKVQMITPPSPALEGKLISYLLPLSLLTHFVTHMTTFSPTPGGKEEELTFRFLKFSFTERLHVSCSSNTLSLVCIATLKVKGDIICFFVSSLLPNTSLTYKCLTDTQYNVMGLIELAPVSLETTKHLHNFQTPGSHH